MGLTKEECNEALNNLKSPTDEWQCLDLQLAENNDMPIEYRESESIAILDHLITEHFDNPPLKFEELKEGMWVWNNRSKRYIKAEKLVVIKKVNYIMSSEYTAKFYIKFEEDRFFAREVSDGN